MAVLYIKEYKNLLMGSQGMVQIPEEPPVAEQTLAIGGASVQSSAFNAATKYVRLNADAVCAVAFGTNPTAVAAAGTGTVAGSGDRLSANTPEYRGVDLIGTGAKIAVITTT